MPQPRSLSIRQAFATLALAALAACSGAGAVPGRHATPATAPSSRTHSDTASALPGDTASAMPGDTAFGTPADTASALPGDTASALPGDTASALPGDTASALPGDTASALPGDTASALPGEDAAGLPGATFGCVGAPPRGSANCTIAVNRNVPPVPSPNLPPSLIAGLHPADLQAAYALPAQNGGGIVAVVDAFDDPSAEADLAVYRTAFGLPPCTSANGCFRKVNQRGQSTYPVPNAGWSQEIALDLDMVSAACPRCSIVLVEADSALLDDLGAGVDTAAALGATAISNSYYAPEWAQETAEDVHYRHPGIAITASSGDRGYPSYPAASQYVTAVGGTSLTRSGGGWAQSAWKYSGHGCSTQVAKPRWQGGIKCRTRAAVDMAVVADPQTGVSMFDTGSGGWLVAGGTSVGAPLVAGAYALSGNPAGPGYSYRHLDAFAGVARGTYGLITGLGSPIGVAGL